MWTKEQRQAYSREYYLRNRDKLLAKNKERSRTPEQREARNVYAAAYREKNREKLRVTSRKSYDKNKAQNSVDRKRLLIQLKTEVATYYGNGIAACVRCGFDDLRALSIDHIDGKGNEERRLSGIIGGKPMYRFLKNNLFPAGYQTLCMNCQFIKRFSEDHKRKQKEEN